MKKKRLSQTRRKIWGAASSAFFCAVIASVCVCMIVLERPTVSEQENRTLATFPKFSLESYFSGEFAVQLDRYFTDTVPFRDQFTNFAALLEKGKGVAAPKFYGVSVLPEEEDTEGTVASVPTQTAQTTPEHNIILPETKPGETIYSAPETVPPVQTSITEISSPSGSDTGSSEFLNNGIIVDGVEMYGEKAGVMLFGGNKKQGKRYAEIINEYKNQLGEDINVYNMVVPTSAEFYLPSKYSKYSNSEKEAIDYIYSNLSEDVISVDAYSILEEHKDEYIYLRTDHHWSHLGAFYAYSAFCDAIGDEIPSLDNYTAVTKPDPYVGSLFGYTNDITLKNNPDTFTYYLPKTEFKGYGYTYDTLTPAGLNPIFHEYVTGYSMFLGGDSVHFKITTGANTGRKIVVFKESYGNAFSTYLIDSFDEIYIIDIRYFGRNAVDYIKQVGATDVLFINNAFAANTAFLIDGIERLLISETGTVVTTVPTTETTLETKTTEEGVLPDEDNERMPQTTEVPQSPEERQPVTASVNRLEELLN